jgi:hypothetical protein
VVAGAVLTASSRLPATAGLARRELESMDPRQNQGHTGPTVLGSDDALKLKQNYIESGPPNLGCGGFLDRYSRNMARIGFHG